MRMSIDMMQRAENGRSRVIDGLQILPLSLHTVYLVLGRLTNSLRPHSQPPKKKHNNSVLTGVIEECPNKRQAVKVIYETN